VRKWLSGVRGTILMILIWTVGWGLGFGGLMELYDPAGEIGDVWLTALAIPGFIGGAVFAALIRVAEGRRRFDEVPLVRFATWGVVTGLVLGGLSVAAKVGDVSPGAAGMTGLAAALSVVAALGSAVFFRLVARRQS